MTNSLIVVPSVNDNAYMDPGVHVSHSSGHLFVTFTRGPLVTTFPLSVIADIVHSEVAYGQTGCVIVSDGDVDVDVDVGAARYKILRQI